MKYKCPICKSEQEYRGVCFNCDVSYNQYKAYLEKDQWILDRLNLNYAEYEELVKEDKPIYEKVQKYYDKLEKNRKYIKGNHICTFEELLKQEIVWLGGGPKPIAFILSMQLNTIKNMLIRKQLCYCIKKQ